MYVRECFDCPELGNGDNRIECLWVRTRKKVSEVDFMMGVCYRPPNEDKETGKIFHKHLGEVSRSLSLVLTGYFDLTSCQLEIWYSREETF